MHVGDLPSGVECRNVISPEWANVSVTTRDGISQEVFCGSARGSAAHPLSDSEIDKKFLACAGQVMNSEDTPRCLGLLKNIDQVRDVRSLFSFNKAYP